MPIYETELDEDTQEIRCPICSRWVHVAGVRPRELQLPLHEDADAGGICKGSGRPVSTAFGRVLVGDRR